MTNPSGREEDLRLPTSFARVLISSRTKVQGGNGTTRSLMVTLYRPMEYRTRRWVCSYRVRLDSSIVAEGSGPGGDPVSAVYMCYVMLATALEGVRHQWDISWVDHEFWWIHDLVPGSPVDDHEST